MVNLYAIARPALFLIPPEEAHEATLRALERGLVVRSQPAADPKLAVTVAGLSFPNPLGIAAGFDKDARVPDAVLGLGCGFAEIGTVTPLPQGGNPRPRVFRLAQERAVINRLGFNNEGHAAALRRLSARAPAGIVGVNIGANKDAADRIADYVAGVSTFYDVASYLMINISSPNTTGLRRLQDPSQLEELLARVMASRERALARGRPFKPVFVKVAPDLDEDDVAPIAAQIVRHNVDAIAISNTTLSRAGVAGPQAREGGGLSGRPLFARSTALLARFYLETGGAIPLIGIGGVDSATTALAKIAAGASLVQLYTGLIYEGPGLIGRILQGLSAEVRRANVTRLEDLRGTNAQEWARRPLES